MFPADAESSAITLPRQKQEAPLPKAGSVSDDKILNPQSNPQFV
jgi:hypothetical protein